MHRARLQAPHNYFEGTVGDATCPISPHRICSVALCDQKKQLSIQCWAQTLHVQRLVGVREPRSLPQSKLTLAFGGQHRLPTGMDRPAFIWMKGRLLSQLIPSHFNLFYLGMGNRKGKKEILPRSSQNTHVNSPIQNALAGYQAVAALGDTQEWKAFGSAQLENVLSGFSGAVPSS